LNIYISDDDWAPKSSQSRSTKFTSLFEANYVCMKLREDLDFPGLKVRKLVPKNRIKSNISKKDMLNVLTQITSNLDYESDSKDILLKTTGCALKEDIEFLGEKIRRAVMQTCLEYIKPAKLRLTEEISSKKIESSKEIIIDGISYVLVKKCDKNS